MSISGGNLSWIIYLILFYKMCFAVCCAFLIPFKQEEMFSKPK